MKTALSSVINETEADVPPSQRDHKMLSVIVGVHVLLALTVSRLDPHKFSLSQQLEDFVCALLIGLLFAFCGYTIYVMVMKRPRQLTRYIAGGLRIYLTGERILFAAPVLTMMPVFASSFSIIKAAVPLIQPFAWDARLASWDRSLHGGVQPWELLQYLFGHPVLTAALNITYHLWFFILLATLYWLAFAMEYRRLRMQFLLSFVLSWILLGNVMAMLFSSAGPCFYGHVVPGPNPYAALMQYLSVADSHIPVLALHVQHTLWNDYAQGFGSTALSISAMPSMHVGSATLLALLGWRLNRKVGIALTIFAVLIMLGSVHLGWHYAIDGYVAAIGAALIWFAIGRLPALREGVRHVA